MFHATICLAAYWLLASVINVLVSLRLAWRMSSAPAEFPDEDLPRAVLLLPLRGSEPRLAATLQSLFHQDYPDYEVRIVVDSQLDPAWPVVQQALATAGARNVHVDVLHERRTNCGSKCSALLQMSADLPVADDDVIVLADGDIRPDASWLRNLVRPLLTDGVELAFGNRWFQFQEGRWGSVVRYLWNSYAVALMWLLQLPWGGSMAVRGRIFRVCGIRERWSKALVDDASIRDAVADAGGKIAFAPQVMLVSPEECDLPSAEEYVLRQLSWTRLYVPGPWRLIAGGTMLLAMLILFSLAAAAYWIQQSQFTLALLSIGGLAANLTSLYVGLHCLEWAMGRRHRREPRDLRTRAAVELKTMLGIPLAMLVQFRQLLAASVTRQYQWRGLTYRVHSPWEVELLTADGVGRNSSDAFKSGAAA